MAERYKNKEETKMKKALSLLIALVMLFSLGITANAAERKELNIFMWSDYISDDLIANF